MANGKQRWRITVADEPRFGGALDWDRWARRLTFATGSATPHAADQLATASASAAPARCFRARVTANLQRLIEELHEEAERAHEQAAELLVTELGH
ncbi:MAG TPA: hypothetical protein VFW73_04330 [Lacipirellulaceae bacterium]|nr:hypothetical protein [Lacipirellulaceae bacterium]